MCSYSENVKENRVEVSEPQHTYSDVGQSLGCKTTQPHNSWIHYPAVATGANPPEQEHEFTFTIVLKAKDIDEALSRVSDPKHIIEYSVYKDR